MPEIHHWSFISQGKYFNHRKFTCRDPCIFIWIWKKSYLKILFFYLISFLYFIYVSPGNFAKFLCLCFINVLKTLLSAKCIKQLLDTITIVSIFFSSFEGKDQKSLFKFGSRYVILMGLIVSMSSLWQFQHLQSGGNIIYPCDFCEHCRK